MQNPPSVPQRSNGQSSELLSKLLGAVYDAALDEAGWVICLEMVRLHFGANYASLIVREETVDDVGLIVSAGQDQASLDPGNPNIAMSPFTGMKPDQVSTISDVMTDKEWRENFYYRNYCAPQGVFHVLAVNLVTRDGGIYGFRITRPEWQTNFSPEEVAFCGLLAPHIKRALNLHLSMNQDRKVSTLYSQAMTQLLVGVVVLDQNGRVIECNPAATEILKLRDGLTVEGEQLVASYPEDNRRLQQMVRDALTTSRADRPSNNEAMSVVRPSGRIAWGLIVQRISSDQWTEGKQRPSVAVFVRDTEGRVDPSVRLAQQLFHLTPAETALAIQLANGLSLEESAEALGIKRNTARAHLRSIFSKTGVRRQTELVRIFLNSVAWLSAGD